MNLKPWWLFLSQLVSCLLPLLVQGQSLCSQCTLSFLCWAQGGVSRGDCDGPSWLYSCCHKDLKRAGRPFRPTFRFLESSEEDSDEDQRFERNEIGPFRINPAHPQFLRHLASPSRNKIPRAPSRFPGPPLGPHIGNPRAHLLHSPLRGPAYRASQKSGGLQYHPNQATMLTMSGKYLPAQCGVQPLKSGIQKRIIGGSEAVFGEYPWQAHIRIAGFQCGGVLVNRQYIATAAHCVHR
ncbi:uncharacterized protein LOC136042551 [Artemia franciscana]|uniref:uncharacterized protein LOC136042551 n=1 Tax=Artemia franciscana TaxID=6661 RepID=UPI0032DBF28E